MTSLEAIPRMNPQVQALFHRSLDAMLHALPLPEPLSTDDSQAIHRLMKRHHLSLFFFHAVRGQKQSAWLTQQLSKQSIQAIQRHLVWTKEMLSIARTFQASGVHCILLKGIPLNKQLHDNQVLRDIRDLDFLIQPGDLLTAHQCLIQSGYQLQSPLSLAQLTTHYSFLMNYIVELPYWHPDKKTYIDLKWHTSSMNPYALRWRGEIKTNVVTFGDQNITVLNREHTFFYLCDHAAQHGWEHLKWLCDLAIFYKKIPFCWQTVVNIAQQAHAIRPLLEASLLLEQVFQIRLNPIPHTHLDKAAVRTRLYFIKKQWFKTIWRHGKGKQYLLLGINLLLYPRLSQKYHYLIRLLLLRVDSLRQIGQLKHPNPLRIILRSFRWIKRT